MAYTTLPPLWRRFQRSAAVSVLMPLSMMLRHCQARGSRECPAQLRCIAVCQRSPQHLRMLPVILAVGCSVSTATTGLMWCAHGRIIASTRQHLHPIMRYENLMLKLRCPGSRLRRPSASAWLWPSSQTHQRRHCPPVIPCIPARIGSLYQSGLYREAISRFHHSFFRVSF
jgi:hypothetical protein